jgi:prepilin-type N-terminal cleavage/methylation domain-containing protein
MKMQRPDCHRAHPSRRGDEPRQDRGHREKNESIQDQFGGCGKIFSADEKLPCKSCVNLCLKNSVSSVANKRAFTLIEMVVAIAILAMVILFAGNIFKSGIGSYRTASAQAEIMRKLRAITEQLNSDFQGLQKDGYLILYSEILSGRQEYLGAEPNAFRADRICFFCTGDFQSWVDPDVKSNIARIYLGHEGLSLADATIPVNHWRLARDVLLLCSGATGIDVVDVNYAWCKVHPEIITIVAGAILSNPHEVDVAGDPNTIRWLLCENAGELKIDWADGIDPNWLGYSYYAATGVFKYPAVENWDAVKGIYKAIWVPSTPPQLWPKALKFTFTLYDSRGIFKQGQTFTHIVYLGE